MRHVRDCWIQSGKAPKSPVEEEVEKAGLGSLGVLVKDGNGDPGEGKDATAGKVRAMNPVCLQGIMRVQEVPHGLDEPVCDSFGGEQDCVIHKVRGRTRGNERDCYWNNVTYGEIG